MVNGQNGDSTPAEIRAWTSAIALIISWTVIACVVRSAVVVVISVAYLTRYTLVRLIYSSSEAIFAHYSHTP